MNQKKTLYILGGLAAFAVVLVVAVNALLTFVPADNTPVPAAIVPPPADATVKIQAPDGSENTKVNIIDAPPDDPRLIIYGENGFSPNAVTVNMSDSIGCLVTIRNKTARAVRIGVNPHSPSGDPGANYGEIAPSEDSIIDPRYTGLVGIVLHDHVRPANELVVTYGEGCR